MSDIKLTRPFFLSWDEVIPARLRSVLLLIGRRLLFTIGVLLAIIWFTFLGLEMATGAPFGPTASTAVSQTIAYLGNALQGDLGQTAMVTSRFNPMPVRQVLPQLLGRSLGLLAVSLLFAAIAGVLMGIYAAHRRDPNQSLGVLVVSIIGVSAPSFFIAFLLQYFLIQWSRWQGQALLPMGGFGWDDHLVLPALVLAARPVAQITRVTFVSVGEALRQDYVRTARSKGLGPVRVMSRHVFRNTAVPILTTVSLSLRFALSSLPIVELFFGWKGIGFYLIKSIAQRDNNLAIALLLSLGLFFILVNLLLEIAYRFIDPRLRDLPESLAAGERETLRGLWQTAVSAVRDWVQDNPLTRWRRRRKPSEPSPFRAILQRRGHSPAAPDEAAERRRHWWSGVKGNIPLWLGGVIVFGLIIVFIFGPALAPQSPYTTRGLEIVDGEFFVPPFAPDETYPWGTDVLGRDILSLVIVGAQQTLRLAALVVLARTLLGLLLGALAGWFRGSWLDQLIRSAAEVLAAFPTLLIAMILILALGIRGGIRPFLIGLSVIGWGETMQFVRGQVISLRPEPFIENAIASGARTSRILLRHILPNFASALISLLALEMGAVLMLLGELGFLSIFIGGGAFAQLDSMEVQARYHYSDVPEWGALISGARLYARSYPWTALYPALAFFISILGFNLLGEGVRRLVETVGISLSRFWNRYVLAGLLAVILAGIWVKANTGATAVYREQASAFDGERAAAAVARLTDPALEGQALGSAGARRTAEFIAGQFEALELQAAGEEFSYFQPRTRTYAQITETPRLQIDDGGLPLAYRRNFAEYLWRFNTLGEGEGPARLIGFNEFTPAPRGDSFGVLRELDAGDQIVLALSKKEADILLNTTSARGVLVVADDVTTLTRRHTIPDLPRNYDKPNMPVAWISEATANRLLQPTGRTAAAWRAHIAALPPDEIVDVALETAVSLSFPYATHETEAVHVIGHLPGASARDLDSRVIVVMAQYDQAPLDPTGIFPAANENGSGVALMLEMIRVMQQTGYQPYRTFLFVAYSGEGLDGGGVAYPPDVEDFLAAKYGFEQHLEIEAVIELRGLGGGAGERLDIAAGGSLRLANVMDTATARLDVPAARGGEPIDIGLVYGETDRRQGGQEAPQIRLSWQGWEAFADTPANTLDRISPTILEEAGRAATLGAMIIGRERQY